MTDGRPVGRVEQIWIYPVRSLTGTVVASAEVGPTGLIGDRAWTVADEAGAPIRAKDTPELAAVSGAGEPAAVAAELGERLGRAVRLEPGADRQGVAPVHLVSRRAVDRAALGDVPEGCSADDPRANLLLSLHGDDEDDGDERRWVGRMLQVGDVVLEVTRTPKHCLGVYAEVRRAGTVTAGDAVLLQGGGPRNPDRPGPAPGAH